MTIAILSAMSEELDRIAGSLDAGTTTTEVANRAYHVGTLHGEPVVAVFSRWGLVAAASTATQVIVDHDPRYVIFTGVAGAVDPALAVGDVVIATDLVQHDMDATPLFERYEIPLLGLSRFHADPALVEHARQSAEHYLGNGLHEDCTPSVMDEFGITAPKAVTGTIASGDRFIASRQAIAELKAGIPEALCVEMEGAAVAQVCYEHGVPCAVIRTISDTADESAGIDFARFISRVASVYSHGIVSHLVQSMAGPSADAP